MSELAARTLTYMALIGAALAIAALGRKVRLSRDVRALPDARRRTSLLLRLREMRGAGANLATCMQYLRGRGLRTGVARGLLIDLERRQAADVKHPHEGCWNGYVFQYPGNWKITPLVLAGCAELGLSIEAVGSGLLMFVRDDGTGPPGDVLIAEQEAQIANPQRRAISTWGGLDGWGAELAGPHKRLRLLVHIAVFSPRAVPVPFTLVQFHAAEEEDLVLPGFHLVQRTLQYEAGAGIGASPGASSPAWGPVSL